MQDEGEGGGILDDGMCPETNDYSYTYPSKPNWTPKYTSTMDMHKAIYDDSNMWVYVHPVWGWLSRLVGWYGWMKVAAYEASPYYAGMHNPPWNKNDPEVIIVTTDAEESPDVDWMPILIAIGVGICAIIIFRVMF